MLRERRERWRSCWASPCQRRWETPWASRSRAPPCWASQSRGRAGNLKTAQPSRLLPLRALYTTTPGSIISLQCNALGKWWSAIGELFCTSMQWSVLMSPWRKTILFSLLIEKLYKVIWLTITKFPSLEGLQAKSSMESIVGNFEVPERGDPLKRSPPCHVLEVIHIHSSFRRASWRIGACASFCSDALPWVDCGEHVENA